MNQFHKDTILNPNAQKSGGTFDQTLLLWCAVTVVNPCLVGNTICTSNSVIHRDFAFISLGNAAVDLVPNQFLV